MESSFKDTLISFHLMSSLDSLLRGLRGRRREGKILSFSRVCGFLDECCCGVCG